MFSLLFQFIWTWNSVWLSFKFVCYFMAHEYFLMGNYRLCGGSVLCCKLPENSDLILQIYSARRSIDLALFISFSRFMYICLYKADIIVYNYPVVLLRNAVIPA